MIRADFIAMWNRGIPIAVIADHFGISDTTVSATAKRYGLAPRQRKQPKDRTALLPIVRARWLAGDRATDIALDLHIRAALVSELAAQLGLPPRRPGNPAWIRRSSLTPTTVTPKDPPCPTSDP